LLVEMQKRHRQRMHDRSRDKTRLESGLQEVEALVAALDPVPGLQEQLHEAEKRHQEIAASLGRATALSALIESIQAQDRLQIACRDAVELLQTLPAPPEQANTAALSSIIDDLSARTAELAQWKERAQALERLQAAPEIRDAATLGNFVRELEYANCALQSLAELDKVFKPLSQPPECADTAPLGELLEKMREATQASDETTQEMREIDAEREAVRAQVRAWAKAHPECPTCGAPVDAESLMEREHSHARREA
jgi:DNA repair exonuclease SbcCD ATPase subunit